MQGDEWSTNLFDLGEKMSRDNEVRNRVNFIGCLV